MSNFKPFAAAIAAAFQTMSQGELHVVDIAGDDLWQAYLAAFPEGTNPMYRVRTEHDGSYDRAFVRRLGNVVQLKNGQVTSIWDTANLPHPYDKVAAVLAAKVRAAAIVGVYRTKEAKLGYESTIEQLEGGATHRWYHFHAPINRRHQAASPAEACGTINTNIGVYKRALTELKLSAFDDVLDLIDNDGLYRGSEHDSNLRALRALFLKGKAYTTELGLNRFLWESFATQPFSVTLLRNTVIGTLLVDLSEGTPLETAVRAFETKVAPLNYKRPTAIITQRMVDDAAATLANLGLESALERRYAVLSDVSVNNVLWVDNGVKSQMKDGIAGLLAKDVASTAKSDKAKDISVDEFMAKVLPKVSSMEVLFSNQHTGNLVSLTAPAVADAEPLFKWFNGFAWSYAGNITDSIKEKVKRAGGNINADLRVSLAWSNLDDLDLHSSSPYGHVYYGVRQGILDVDMNAPGTRHTRSPVENQSWVKPTSGTYRIWVNQYARREATDVGFTIELAYNGKVEQFSYPKAVVGNVDCFEFTVNKGVVSDLKILDKALTGGSLSQERWGIKTETFVKVNTLMLSPNYWNDQEVGNKHWLFFLDGCINDEPTRGIYNEFLRGDLDKHRKVFEVLGNRTKCPASTEQLSGLGFSSTQRSTLTVRVKGTGLQATYNINF